jgi:hypothetical protein
MTRGSKVFDTDWKVPMSIRLSPARNRWTPSASSSARRSRSRACCRITSPSGVIRTGFGPPGRSNSAPPADFSRTAICWLTLDWVYPSLRAARPNDPSSATAASVAR